ncbi:hypothetical protein C8J57DRAFT_1063015, partial [Mycena rebaudengoi]
GYSYVSIAYTWYYRMHEKGHDAPTDVHPNKVYKPGVKVNFSQRIPVSTIDTLEKSEEFEGIVNIFAEVFEFQRINVRPFPRFLPLLKILKFKHANPNAFDEVRMFADVLPLNSASPMYPFAGFMINLRVVTDAHKDSKDAKWCLIIFINDGEGGHLCLHELGLKINGKTGNLLAFPSCWITHFNTHFEGLRCTLVLHTDKDGLEWEKDGGGWGHHIVRHKVRYCRN